MTCSRSSWKPGDNNRGIKDLQSEKRTSKKPQLEKKASTSAELELLSLTGKERSCS